MGGIWKWSWWSGGWRRGGRPCIGWITNIFASLFWLKRVYEEKRKGRPKGKDYYKRRTQVLELDQILRQVSSLGTRADSGWPVDLAPSFAFVKGDLIRPIYLIRLLDSTIFHPTVSYRGVNLHNVHSKWLNHKFPRVRLRDVCGCSDECDIPSPALGSVMSPTVVSSASSDPLSPAQNFG
jgi:hypothetical protein